MARQGRVLPASMLRTSDEHEAQAQTQLPAQKKPNQKSPCAPTWRDLSPTQGAEIKLDQLLL